MLLKVGRTWLLCAAALLLTHMYTLGHVTDLLLVVMTTACYLQYVPVQLTCDLEVGTANEC